jgi:hypothetical protein
MINGGATALRDCHPPLADNLVSGADRNCHLYETGDGFVQRRRVTGVSVPVSAHVSARSSAMKAKMFDELRESVREGGAILRGESKPSRRFELPATAW